MVKKIVSNIKENKAIIVAAQNLINETFDGAAERILGKTERRGSTRKRTIEFRRAIHESKTLTEEEKRDVEYLCDKKVYKKAREIILELTKKEIKH